MPEKPTYEELEQRVRDLEKAEYNYRRTAEELFNTNTLIDAVFDAIPDIIGIQDPHHGMIRYNAAGYTVLGQTPEGIAGKKCFELIGHDDPCSICATSETYRTKKPAQVEKFVHELGIWLDVRSYPILDTEGRIQLVIEHLRDITDKKRIEEALYESEKRYRNLFKNNHAAMLVVDPENANIVDANPAAVSFYGWSLEDLTSKKVTDINTLAEEQVFQEMRQAKAQQRSQFIFRHRLANGDIRDVEVYSGPINLHGKQLLFSIIHDISERIKADEVKQKLHAHLQRVQKMESIGTLAGGIAHNFNNILMGIQGRASLLMVNKSSSHPDYENLKGIEECVKSAAELTRDLLGFARGGKYEIKPTDLNALIKHENKVFGRTKKEIIIHGKFAKALWPAEVDRGQIQQVLLNLYMNAWQAMPDGGDIYIQTTNVTLTESFVKSFEISPGRYIKISVTDTGIGIDDAIKDMIFDPFFSTKDRSQSSGLGLASVYGIVKNHEGGIDVFSEKGKGTTFNIYIPASNKKPVEEDLGSKKLEVQHGRGTILLVDDEGMVVEVGQKMLESLNYRVIIARSGKEALDVYQGYKDEIDLIVLDMVMPGMGGGETYDRLKKADEDVRVLLSSGYSINGQAKEILERGCVGFIQKPFSLSDLSIKIKEVFEGLKG